MPKVIHTPLPALDDFLTKVRDEVIRAQRKFPGNRQQLAAFFEEAGELSKAMIEHHIGQETPEGVQKEAIQTAAMAVRLFFEGSSEFKWSFPLQTADGQDATDEMGWAAQLQASKDEHPEYAVVLVLDAWEVSSDGGAVVYYVTWHDGVKSVVTIPNNEADHLVNVQTVEALLSSFETNAPIPRYGKIHNA